MAPPSTHYDADLIQQFASGHWPSIHAELTSLDAEILAGGDHPCPLCDGHDRFNVCRKSYAETGKVFCKEPCRLNGAAGLGVVQQMTNCKFPDACGVVGEWLIRNGHATSEQLTLRKPSSNSDSLANNSQPGKRKRKPSPPRLTAKGKEDRETIRSSQGKWKNWLKHSIGRDETDKGRAGKREQELQNYAANKPGIDADYLVKSTARIFYKKQHGWCVVFVGVTSDKQITGVQIVRVDGKPIQISEKVSNKSQNIKGSKDGWFCPAGHQAMLDADVLVKCEGPLDTVASQPLLPAGTVAVTNLCGATSWPKHDIEWLRIKAAIIIVHDADIPGQTGGMNLAQVILKLTADVSNIRLPYPEESDHGKDLRDWVAEGGTPEQFQQLVASAEKLEANTKKRKKRVTTSVATKLVGVEEVGDAETVYMVANAASVAALKGLGLTAVAVDDSKLATSFDWKLLATKQVTFILGAGNASALFTRNARWILKEFGGPPSEVRCFGDDPDYGDEFELEDAESWRAYHKDRSDEWLKERIESLQDQAGRGVFAPEAPAAPTNGPNESGQGAEDDESPNPSSVAAAMLATEFDRNGKRILIHWRGDFYRWSGAWFKMERDELTSFVGKWLIARYENPMQHHITNVVTFLQAETFLPGSTEQNTWLDGKNHGHRIAVDNGLLDPQSGELESPTPSWFSNVILPCEFDPHATCDRWLKILNANLEGDIERINLLQEFTGYLLWPTLEFQKFLILLGEGSNGKSVYIAGLQALLGRRNVSNYSLESLGNNRFAAAGTIGRLANLCADVSEVDRLSEGILKQLVSGDRLTLDRKNQSLIEATPTAKLVFSCNNLPRFRDKSFGMSRRMIITPFNREVLPEERIQGLDRPEAWTEELSGMLNWALEGLHRLLRNGSFTNSTICDHTAAEYRQDNNPASAFIEEFLAVNEAPESYVLKSDVYAAYRHWCDNHGRRALCDAEFAKEVRRSHRGVEDGRKRIGGGGRLRVFYGLRLLLHPAAECRS